MRDVMLCGSMFHTEEAATTTKVRSPTEERRVAGMANKEDAAQHKCFH